MNREKIGRDGFNNPIKNNLSYDSAAVHTYDSVTINEVSGERTYVLFTQQTANNDANYRQWSWRSTITLEIISKQISSVSKDIVDDVGDQIEQIIMYGTSQPGESGVEQQAGWEIRDVMLDSVNYTEFQLNTNDWEITKIMIFSYLITKL